MPSADLSGIHRLRHGGKTWNRIRAMGFPGRNSKSLRRAVLQHDNGSGEYRKPYPGEMSPADIADIQNAYWPRASRGK